MDAATHPRVVPVRRRRSALGDPLKKVTIQLSQSIVDAIKSAVEIGDAASANVFVEEAIRDKLRERRRARVYAAYEQAAQDPAYIAEIDSDTRAYDVTLSDNPR